MICNKIIKMIITSISFNILSSLFYIFADFFFQVIVLDIKIEYQSKLNKNLHEFIKNVLMKIN